MTNYLEITFQISSDVSDIAIAELESLGFEGFDETDLPQNRLKAWIPASSWNKQLEDEAHIILKKLTGKEAAPITIQEIEHRNWNQEWESRMKPVAAGQFLIRPSWTTTEDEKEAIQQMNAGEASERITLHIDPKMSFGTGYHETTRIMLRFLPEAIAKLKSANPDRKLRVLDAGTGTGVLGIAAIKLGADYAFGFDIDEWSAENAGENADRNLSNETGKFEVVRGDAAILDQKHHAAYDLVIANINRNILEEMDEALCKCIRQGGTLLLSGLLHEDEVIIRNHGEYKKLNFIEKREEGEWIGVWFEF